MVCKKCGQGLDEGARFCKHCGESSVAGKFPATALRRLANYFIDRVSFLVFCFVLGIVLAFTKLDGIFVWALDSKIFEILSGIVLYVFFFAFFEAIWQRTPSKWITKTKVVTRDGKKPSFLQILGRSFARLIPFDAFSFLVKHTPIGWHDKLSKTLVVPSSFTEEDVKNLDYPGIKAQRSSFLLVLAVILVAIAVVGILAGVVLTNLSSARNKAAVAAANVELTSFRTRAIVYESEKKTFEGFCNEVQVSGSYCNDSKDAWVVALPIKASAKLVCLDSTLTIPTQISGISAPAIKCTADLNGWTDFTSKEGDFSVLLPVEPTKESNSFPSKTGSGSITVDSYISFYQGNLYTVVKNRVSSYISVSDALDDGAIDVYIKGIMEEDDTLVSSRHFDLGGNRAADFLISKGEMNFKGRVILSNYTMYLIGSVHASDDYNEDDYNKFLNSFELN